MCICVNTRVFCLMRSNLFEKYNAQFSAILFKWSDRVLFFFVLLFGFIVSLDLFSFLRWTILCLSRMC